MLTYYKIEYEKSVLTQIKRLITKEEYKEYTDLSFELDAAEIVLKKQKKNPTAIENVKRIKGLLKPYKFPFFVVGSPMHTAIESGTISLPEVQGGDHRVKMTLLENEDLVKCVDENDDD